MAYISTERVSEIRKEIKKLFPEFKFSIRRDDYSGVIIDILEAPMMLTDQYYQSINPYYIKGLPEFQQKFIQPIHDIAAAGREFYETGDYGTQPSHYVYISIGNYNNPFKMVVKEKGKVVCKISNKNSK